ncbi:MAG TPA: acyl-CoA dehydrogenase family protein [Acidimicrobiales bacterium]|nr:acyl-CoA dehydrogenase family protein [Acidimicrobiales bacterium]
MDFTFSPEQDALRDAVRSFLTRTDAAAYYRAMIEDDRGFTDEWWQEISQLGWPGLLVPEAAGGTGLGMVDAVVLQEEMGRVALPGPYLSSSIAATLAARHLGADDLLEGLAGGTRRGTVALEEPGHGDPLGTVRVTATGPGPSWTLDGVKELVMDGHTADFAIVAARTAEGLAAFVVDQPDGTFEPALDVTRKTARLELSGRPARRIGPPGDQTAQLARIRDDVAVALCAETVGAAERALQMAIEYAKQRVQFDRPIATFQAIKHKIVDMLHQLELARVGTHWAAWCSDVDDPMREQAAAACKAFVAEAAVMVTAENIQVHGGVGFTWDLDCHLLFRRVKQNDILFGNQAWNRARLADLVLGPA